MEPVAIVTLFIAVLYVAGRGAYALAPRATAEFYGRALLGTDRRLRAFGVALLILVAIPVLVTVREAPVDARVIVFILKAFGWLAAAAGVWIVATPGVCRRLVERKLSDVSDPVLRGFGVLSVGFGLFLAWNAFFVL